MKSHEIVEAALVKRSSILGNLAGSALNALRGAPGRALGASKRVAGVAKPWAISAGIAAPYTQAEYSLPSLPITGPFDVAGRNAGLGEKTVAFGLNTLGFRAFPQLLRDRKRALAFSTFASTPALTAVLNAGPKLDQLGFTIDSVAGNPDYAAIGVDSKTGDKVRLYPDDLAEISKSLNKPKNYLIDLLGSKNRDDEDFKKALSLLKWQDSKGPEFEGVSLSEIQPTPEGAPGIMGDLASTSAKIESMGDSINENMEVIRDLKSKAEKGLPAWNRQLQNAGSVTAGSILGGFLGNALAKDIMRDQDPGEIDRTRRLKEALITLAGVGVGGFAGHSIFDRLSQTPDS